MTTRVVLETVLPAGFDPDRTSLPDDVGAALAPVGGTSGGFGFEQRQDGRWLLRVPVRGEDRLALAESVRADLAARGYDARVRVHR